MFQPKPATSEQMVAGAQQQLDFLRGQLLIFLKQKRAEAVRKMAQAGASAPGTKPAAGEEDLSWLEQAE